MVAPVRFSIGPKRISKSMTPAQAGYVSYMRGQFKEIEQDFADFIGAINGVAPQAVEKALKEIFDLSQVYVPVDTAKLKRSGFVEVRQTSKGVTGSVGYAKGGVPHYAVFVHENLEVFHKPPTQAKFLERAADEKFFAVQKILIEEYEQAAEKKTKTKVKFTIKGEPSQSDRQAALQLPGSNK